MCSSRILTRLSLSSGKRKPINDNILQAVKYAKKLDRRRIEDLGLTTTVRAFLQTAKEIIGLVNAWSNHQTSTELERLVERENKEVIVVGHQYGGVVITQAVHEKFGNKARAAQGLKGGVLQLVYVSAIVVEPEQSPAGAFDGHLPPWLKIEVNFDILLDNLLTTS